jgi:hypothetical protein
MLPRTATAQPVGFEQAQARAVEQAGDEVRRSVHAREESCSTLREGTLGTRCGCLACTRSSSQGKSSSSTSRHRRSSAAKAWSWVSVFTRSRTASADRKSAIGWRPCARGWSPRESRGSGAPSGCRPTGCAGSSASASAPAPWHASGTGATGSPPGGLSCHGARAASGADAGGSGMEGRGAARASGLPDLLSGRRWGCSAGSLGTPGRPPWTAERVGGSAGIWLAGSRYQRGGRSSASTAQGTAGVGARAGSGSLPACARGASGERSLEGGRGWPLPVGSRPGVTPRRSGRGGRRRRPGRRAGRGSP